MQERPLIVVVEDDADQRYILTYVLNDLGYKVVSSEKARILSELDPKQIGLIILDIRLKAENGAKICKALKTNRRSQHIPILLLSAIDDLEQIALDASADALLAKPHDLEDLKIMVQKLLPLPKKGL